MDKEEEKETDKEGKPSPVVIHPTQAEANAGGLSNNNKVGEKEEKQGEEDGKDGQAAPLAARRTRDVAKAGGQRTEMDNDDHRTARGVSEDGPGNPSLVAIVRANKRRETNNQPISNVSGGPEADLKQEKSSPIATRYDKTRHENKGNQFEQNLGSRVTPTDSSAAVDKRGARSNNDPITANATNEEAKYAATTEMIPRSRPSSTSPTVQNPRNVRVQTEPGSNIAAVASGNDNAATTVGITSGAVSSAPNPPERSPSSFVKNSSTRTVARVETEPATNDTTSTQGNDPAAATISTTADAGASGPVPQACPSLSFLQNSSTQSVVTIKTEPETHEANSTGNVADAASVAAVTADRVHSGPAPPGTSVKSDEEASVDTAAAPDAVHSGPGPPGTDVKMEEEASIDSATTTSTPHDVHSGPVPRSIAVKREEEGSVDTAATPDVVHSRPDPPLTVVVKMEEEASVDTAATPDVVHSRPGPPATAVQGEEETGGDENNSTNNHNNDNLANNNDRAEGNNSAQSNATMVKTEEVEDDNYLFI